MPAVCYINKVIDISMLNMYSVIKTETTIRPRDIRSVLNIGGGAILLQKQSLTIQYCMTFQQAKSIYMLPPKSNMIIDMSVHF